MNLYKMYFSPNNFPLVYPEAVESRYAEGTTTCAGERPQGARQTGSRLFRVADECRHRTKSGQRRTASWLKLSSLFFDVLSDCVG